MKKILLSLMALAMITACSSDNESIEDGSALIIDGGLFEPGINTESEKHVVTSFVAGTNSGASNTRTFTLERINDSDKLEIVVIYPVAKSSIDGTYAFNNGTGNPNSYAKGSLKLSELNTVTSGTVKVKDLGDNKFLLKFSNIALVSPSEELIPFEGYFQGTFFSVE